MIFVTTPLTLLAAPPERGRPIGARIVAPLLAVLLALLPMGGQPVLAEAAPAAIAARAKPYSTSRGPNTSPFAVLSFDDCPRSAAAFRRVVLQAEQLNIALVLFPTGQCIRAGRFNVAFARRHGHYVFNHSVSHPDLTRLSSAAIRRQLSKPGVVTNYGRPPYGAVSARVRAAYRAKGMRIWLWSVDTNDWRGKSRSAVVRYVVRNTRRGQTVLMHMQWNGFSKTALRDMRNGLARRGIKVCRNYPGTAPARPRGALRC
jgi:peptidoglycan-N-acetylglucosamine deacetylase